MKPLHVVFFGTPAFAVPSLRILEKSVHRISLVVTQPDRPKGRGRKMTPPPVKTAAAENGLPVLQPESIRRTEFIDKIRAVLPDVLVVVAYGRILPENLLSVPPLGAVNVHASLLPEYRGPAPIQRAIINGDAQTGVTTMLMDEGMDTGDLLLRRSIDIGPRETAATLHDRLAELGASLLAETLPALASGAIKPEPQDHGRATYAPMLKKQDGRIDWHMPAKRIAALIRGMNPWPVAFTDHGARRLKIFSAQALEKTAGAAPGTVLKGFADELRVSTGDGVLSIDEIQGPSGKRLRTADFLRGYDLPPGARLG